MSIKNKIMIIEETYLIKENSFDKEGYNYETSRLFVEQINVFEKDFQKKYPFTPANSLYIGYSGMQLIKRCYFSEGDKEWESEIYGQDVIFDDAELNFEANFKMNKFSSKTLVYAISSAIDLDEPLFLFIDCNQQQNSLTLKYDSSLNDNDDSENEIVISPLDEVLNKQLKSILI
jgi:hypothetical protein